MDDFNEYVLITERPGSNIINYKPMKLDEIQRFINMFFKVSKYAIELEQERQKQSETAPAA
jgi:hypothetical protein